MARGEVAQKLDVLEVNAELGVLVPQYPEEVKVMIGQLGKIVDIYLEILIAWARPPIVYHKE